MPNTVVIDLLSFTLSEDERKLLSHPEVGGLLLFTRNIQEIPFTNTLIWYTIALALVATVLPSFLMSNGMKMIGSNNVSIIISIGPVSTIIQAHFFLGEPIIFPQIVGTIFVIIGVLLIGWQSKRSSVEVV